MEKWQEDLGEDAEKNLLSYLNLEWGTPDGPDALRKEELSYVGKFFLEKYQAFAHYWSYPCNRGSGCWGRVVMIDGYHSYDMTMKNPNQTLEVTGVNAGTST